MANINRQIANELGVREQQVEATVTLLDDGATVPFVARYRKEITGGLDDAQLRTLEERLNYLRELEERRKAILESVREQGKLLDAARWRRRSLPPTAKHVLKTSICRSSPSVAPRQRLPRRRALSRCPSSC